MAPTIRIGTIGWNYPEWRGPFYPPGAKPATFLTHYAKRFPLVEAASAQYGMPKTEVVANWAAKTPDGFSLAIKVPDWIVRKKAGDPDLPRALDLLLTHLAPLADAGKLGALIAQFHPSFRRDKKAEHLASFVAALPPGPSWSVELRDASWWHADTYRLLTDAGITLVWSDLGAAGRTPPVATTSRLYLRLLGERDIEPPFDATRRDARSLLAHWAERVETAAPAVDQVDIVVSKYLEGFAPGTADKLAEMLGVDLRPAPMSDRAGQMTLDML